MIPKSADDIEGDRCALLVVVACVVVRDLLAADA